ncbi:uncharacterized protein LOC133931158 [Phragmites australis]|uniref:uncharacterized protein LOC133931158 n=1 Tax=Phragmites australis TaxID=29695 RepID=UPI002D76E0CE|nr:uncharacterized protein LOC133931158 [Phragmites australis]
MQMPPTHPPPPSFPSSCRCRCCCLQQMHVTKNRPLATSDAFSVSADYAKKEGGRRRRVLAPPPSALPEPQAAAASVLVAGIVGVAATLLLRSSSSQQLQQQQDEEAKEDVAEGEECRDCGGTGLCGRCKGEGFVFKQLSEETATKARRTAKNMATRYTAGLPTKWTYCNKCSSTRSCTTCGGSGRIGATITTT